MTTDEVDRRVRLMLSVQRRIASTCTSTAKNYQFPPSASSVLRVCQPFSRMRLRREQRLVSGVFLALNVCRLQPPPERDSNTADSSPHVPNPTGNSGTGRTPYLCSAFCLTSLILSEPCRNYVDWTQPPAARRRTLLGMEGHAHVK